MKSFLCVPLALFLCTAALSAELPTDHPWQKTLRAHLATLEEQDFEIKNHSFEYPAAYEQVADDRLYRDWIVLGHLGREPPIAAFQAAPAHFTLHRIEGDQIRIFPEPAAMAWWIQFDFPGNPYAGSKPGKQRALGMAMVDMVMLETAHRADPRNLKPDFMASNIGAWAYCLHHCGEDLPKEVAAAYRLGILHYFELMVRLAPRDGNTNMDMRELVTLAELGHVFPDEAFRARLATEARRILFGDAHRGPSTSDPRRGTFHPAGYIGEADGPETSYNGISLYHLAEAAMISRGQPEWDAFLPEVVERMVRFKAYNTFPQPDGSYEGPSSWSKRTNDPYVRDQRDRPWRAFAEAMLTKEALYRLKIDPANAGAATYGLADRGKMLSDVRQGVDRLSRRPSKPERWNAEESPVWQEEHWPADLPYTWDHYIAGSYDRFRKAAEDGSVWLQPPYDRDGDFNINFDGEFWSVKRGDWGFQVEAVPHMGRSYDTGGSGALAGGSLPAFWTRHTGVVVLGRLPDKWNNVTWDKIRAWPTHHLWGLTAEGSGFSSARQRDPWVNFETEGQSPRVHVFGDLGGARTVQTPDILDAGHVSYRRTFTLEKDGLRVESQLLSLGQDQIRELWESLPILLTAMQPRQQPVTKLEFLINNKWQPGSEELTPNVLAVRASRFEGAVEIRFDAPQRVRLSPVIETVYQKRDRLQMVQIDLLGSNGQATAMPQKAEVNYVIRAASK